MDFNYRGLRRKSEMSAPNGLLGIITAILIGVGAIGIYQKDYLFGSLMIIAGLAFLGWFIRWTFKDEKKCRKDKE